MEIKNNLLEEAFEICLAAMGTGVDLETCLKLYPDLEADLRPMLIAAGQVKALRPAEVPAAAMNRSRARMLTRADQLRRARRPFFWGVAPRLAMALAALVLVLFLSLNGLVVASAQTLPGDALYPVKLAAENVSLQLATDAETRLIREDAYQERRAGEIRALLEQERVHRISFEGVVEEVNGERMLVQGIPVALSDNAVVIGEVAPGRLVEVEGTTQPGGWVNADELHLRFFEYVGQLQEIQTGLWRIGDRVFVILANTHLDPTLRLGEQVLALVYTGDDGTPYAQAVLRVPETLVKQQDDFEPFEIEFTGTVQGISGDDLLIDGKTVRLTGDTEIQGDIAIGSLLTVHALVSPDGILTAREIQPAGSGDTPTGDSSGEDEPGGDGDQPSEEDEDGQPGGDDSENGEDGQPGGDDSENGEDENHGGDDSGSDDGESSGSGSEDDKAGADEGGGSGEDDDGGEDDQDDDSGNNNGDDSADDDQSGEGDDSDEEEDDSGSDTSGEDPDRAQHG